jgi:Amt family ammonium transporter
VLNKIWGIRVDPSVETQGLDVHEHGMWGYPEFYIPVPGGYGTESHGHLSHPPAGVFAALTPPEVTLSGETG